MGTTLIINPGSTSKKYALFRDDKPVFTLRFEQTSSGYGVCREIKGESQLCENITPQLFAGSFEECLEILIKEGEIKEPSEIAHIGLRVVAPGGFFRTHRVIDENYVETLTRAVPQAPLHIPPVIEELARVRETMPYAVVVAVSDSAFHDTIPDERRTFSIPTDDAYDYGIFRYGYHGLSVGSVARRMKDFFGVLPEDVVVAHVGGGISLTALHVGKSVDTTMGYSPASGMIMGTRAGDLDADALIGIMSQKDLDIEELYTYVNMKGGFKGLCGVNDLRVVLNRAATGEPEAKRTLAILSYQFQRNIGALAATLGGLDAIVLTGTAVVRNPAVRALLLGGFGFMGIVLNDKRNDDLINNEGMIHDSRSAVSVGVMKTDEMGEMYKVVSDICR